MVPKKGKRKGMKYYFMDQNASKATGKKYRCMYKQIWEGSITKNKKTINRNMCQYRLNRAYRLLVMKCLVSMTDSFNILNSCIREFGGVSPQDFGMLGIKWAGINFLIG